MRAGLAVLAPSLIGEDPRELEKLNRRMDAAAEGPSVREVRASTSPAGTSSDRRRESRSRRCSAGATARTSSSTARSRRSRRRRWRARVAGYRAEGYRRFQLKVGGDPDVDIERIRAVRAVLAPGEVLIADANTGWLPHEAVRVVRAVRDVDVYIEQPCATYEECLSIRRRTDHPFVLDETIDGLGVLLRAAGDRAMDVVNLKIWKLGGLTRTRQARDLCVVARRRHDDRGLLGRRRDDGGDRAPRALHADRAALHLDRLQQLRHGVDRGRARRSGRTDGWPRRRAPGLGVTPRPEFLRKPAVDVS